MKIEEFMKTLPGEIVSGEGVSLPERSLREIFRFAGMNSGDVFYHLGCGDEKGVSIAVREFNVRKAVGIDNSCEKIENARSSAGGDGFPGSFICQDVRDSDISDATVVLFWFADEGVIRDMMGKFGGLEPGTRIVTVWGPLPGCLPHAVEFPYIINKVPLKTAGDLQEQLLAVFGVKCIDFVTAWEFAERYTKSIAGPNVRNDRFLTIIQTLTIWINARNLGIACGEGVPESIQTYINIMREHFDIDFGHLLRE